MSHARSQHPNAPLTPEGRRRMVTCVLEAGWTIEATAQRFQVDAKTVRKWRDRFVAEGEGGLMDRSSRPHRSPFRTERRLRRRVVTLRRRRRWGADRIGFEVGLAASTVQQILTRAGLGRLDCGDRATNTTPPQRYQRDLPGELIHVDIKKLAAIPDGGGWRIHGRGGDGHHGHSGVGYRYIHTAVDDRHPHRVLRDPPQRTSHHRCRVLGPRRRLVHLDRHHLRESHHRQRILLPIRTVASSPANRPAPPSRRPDPAGPKPTGKLNGSTASC